MPTTADLQTRDRRRAFREASLVWLALILITGVGLIGTYESARSAMQRELRDDLIHLAYAAASQIDGDLHRQLRDQHGLDGALYDQVVTPLRRMRAGTPGVRNVYTVVRDGDVIRLVVDAAHSTDHNHDGRGERARMWRPFRDFEPEMLMALGSPGTPGSATASKRPYDNSWGTVVTGYAPFHDSSGRQAGVVAVDVDAGFFEARLLHARFRTLLGTVPAILMSFLMAIGVYRIRLRGLATRRAERESRSRLKASEERFRAMADASPAMIWLTDEHGASIYANQRLLEFTGRSMDDALGDGWLETVHPDDRSLCMRQFRTAMANGAPFELQFRLRRHDGEYRWFNNWARPQFDLEGGLIGYVGLAVDITDERAAKARLAAFATNAPAAVAMLDTQLRYVAVTQRWLDDFRLQDEDILGKCHLDVFPNLPDRWRNILARCLEGHVMQSRHECWRPPGWDHDQHLQWEVRPWYDVNGRIGGIMIYIADITEIKQTELSLERRNEELAAAVRRNRELFQAIDATHDGVLVTDARGIVTYVNRAFERMTGWPQDKALGQSPVSLLHAGEGNYDDRRLWSAEAADPSWTERLLIQPRREPGARAVDGGPATEPPRPLWVEMTVTSIRDEQDRLQGRVAVLRDTTEQVEREQFERRAREGTDVRLAVAQAIQVDRPLCERIEQAVQRLFEMDDVWGERKAWIYVKNDEQSPLRLYQYIHGDNAASCSIDLARHVSALLPCNEIPSAVRVVDKFDTPLDARFADDARTNESLGELECKWPRGLYIVPLAHAGTAVGVLCLAADVYPSHDAARLDALRQIGELLAVAIIRDRAARMWIEAREKAEAANRAKSEFLTNMSHEIRTPLTAILGCAEVLRDDEQAPGDAERRRALIDTIRNAGRHLLTIINDILDLSKIESGQLRLERIETRLLDILSEVESLMRPQIEGKGVALRVVLATPVPDRILGDPTRIRQILLNLVGNASKFTEAGAISVGVSVVDTADPPRLRVDVEDTGVGMDGRQADVLFRPFTQADASTTRRFGGTGMGLTICRRLARMMGGDVWLVRSELGRGSCFRLEIPIEPFAGATMVAAMPSPSTASPPERAASARRLNGRILLAEDGPDNQRLISFLLRKAGAEVDIAQDGREALAMFEASKGGYDLIITDVQMPEMDGHALARALRQRGVTTPIVALTAHALPEHRDLAMQAGCTDYASKPLDREQLIRLCERLLHPANPSADSVPDSRGDDATVVF